MEGGSEHGMRDGRAPEAVPPAPDLEDHCGGVADRDSGAESEGGVSLMCDTGMLLLDAVLEKERGKPIKLLSPATSLS